MKKYITEIVNYIISENEFSFQTKKLLSIICLSISFVITLLPYTYTVKFLGFELWPRDLEIQPSFLTTCLSFGLVVPLYARRILRWSNSVYGTIMFVLFTSIFASLFQIGMGGDGHEASKYIIGAAILISWIGITGLAGYAWILAIVAAIFNIITADLALGFLGFVLLCSTALGLLMHSDLSPSKLATSLQEEFSSVLKRKADKIQEDLKNLSPKQDEL